MYENNYPNNYNNPNKDQDPVNGSYSQMGSNTYYYGSSGSFSGTDDGFHRDPYQPDSGKKKKKGKRESSGAGKKIMIGMCCGLAFGVFAGLGFQAVDTATDLLKDKTGLKMLKEQEDSEADESVGQTDVALVGSSELNLTEEDLNKIASMINTQNSGNTITDVSDVVEQVMPSMVSVNKKYVERMSFWGQEYSQEGTGSGSGIIVGQNDTELLLVSNYHVVESPEELTVVFVDGSQAQAQIKGLQEDKDLAVIAVQLTDISSDTMSQISIAKLGSSDSLTLGEPVIAIGNALGYGQSVTTGVVSALNRPIGATELEASAQTGDAEVNTFIQTNAAINPGNSGGALLNIHGEVIGITSNKIGATTVEGMGYAIPISDVEPIIEDLMSRETKLKVDEADKGFLGITGLDVDAEYAQLYDAPKGVFVSSVTEGSGADKAGLVRGDIIVAIDGVDITAMVELKNYLEYCAAGTTVKLTIMQGSPVGYQAKEVEVTLGAQSVTQ